MSKSVEEVQVLILIVGIIVLFSILIKSALNRVSIPGLIGYMILGFLIRWADSEWGFLSEREFEVFEFLASIGDNCAPLSCRA